MWPDERRRQKRAALLLDKMKGKAGKESVCFCSWSISTSDQFLLRWLWESSFPFLRFILHLDKAAECQVFSRLAFSPVCHELSAGHLLAQFKEQHGNLVRWDFSSIINYIIPPQLQPSISEIWETGWIHCDTPVEIHLHHMHLEVVWPAYNSHPFKTTQETK